MEAPNTSLAPEALRFALYNRFLKGEAKVPQMPESLLRVRRLLNDPHASLERLARTINSDPPLTAWLMQYAESPLLLGFRPCTSLRDILSRLGTRRLHNLVLCFGMRNLFIGKEPALQRVFRARWKAALERAAYAAALAELTGLAEVDDALLAGLLQDVGSLPLLAELEKWPQKPRTEAALHELCEHLSGDVGVVVMTVWKLPTVMIECARHRRNWPREHIGKADLADLVQVASHLATPLDEQPLATLPAFQRLRETCPGLPRDPSQLVETLADGLARWRLLLGSRLAVNPGAAPGSGSAPFPPRA